MKQSGKEKENSMKSAIVVAGALAFGWMTIELALKPFLKQARDAMDKSDATRDPDDEEPSGAPKSSLSTTTDDVSDRAGLK
ncbi:outer envelope membrane protein 7-like [Telopea speciosissima]|uniref:outer envelope membrane protein 7-like n=1 Tax=Telopea speciosissima TaxID=54955 RepID=UPI001CC5EFB4|nr:outer envelope membrane protein 7-like [Telopea speciosissima]